MKRRVVVTSAAALTLAGCTGLTTTEREVTAEPLDLELERREVIGFFHEERELGRFAVGTGAWANVPYEFRVAASSEDGIEWHGCTIEFAFPDADIRPPEIYLQGDTTVPIASFERRDLADEFTTLELRDPTDGFDFALRAQPLASDRDVEEIPIEVNFEGRLVESGLRDTEYRAAISISSTLVKELV